jgi:hypothetical protein
MSAARPLQTTEPQELTDYDEYQFEGNSGTVENKHKFVHAIRMKASIYHAAQMAGVGRTTVYRWLDSDPVFAEAVANAGEDAGDRMETSVYERAFSDNLLAMFWLKAHRHKFRDKVMIDINAVDEEIKQRLGTLNSLQIPAPSTELQKEPLQLPAGPPTSDDDPHQS